MQLNMTLAQVQQNFASPLSPFDLERYQSRLDLALGVEWRDGAYYAIGDADELPSSYDLYQCHIENGMIFLGLEDACGSIDEYEPVYFVLYRGCTVIPQF